MQDNLAAGARVDSRRGFWRRDRQPTRDADQSGREEQGEQGDEHEPDHDARGGLTERASSHVIRGMGKDTDGTTRPELASFGLRGQTGANDSRDMVGSHARHTHALSVVVAVAALAAAAMTASSALMNSGWAVLWMEWAAPSNLRTSLGLGVRVRARARARARVGARAR